MHVRVRSLLLVVTTIAALTAVARPAAAKRIAIAPAAGSAAPAAGSAAPAPMPAAAGEVAVPAAAPVALPVAPAPAPAAAPTDNRVAGIAALPVPLPPPGANPVTEQACTELLLANRGVADKVFETVNAEQAKQLVAARTESHQRAAAAVQKNERHVILAYGALWLLAVGFVIFLWRRQAGLKAQIAALRADLDRATK